MEAAYAERRWWARREGAPLPTLRFGSVSVMVRMLVADDFAELFRAIILQRGLARQVDDGPDPAQPRLGSKLQGRDHPVRPVERAGHDLDLSAADAAEAERRAAGGAEIAHRNRRGAEGRWFSTRPGKMLVRNVGE